MADEKCCCNCIHCARWQTSKGIECHCDLTDRYLSYLDVMDTDNDCCRWEKETKWDIEKQHDREIYNKAIDDFADKAIKIVYEANNRDRNPQPRDMVADIHYKFIEFAEQLKEKKNDD